VLRELAALLRRNLQREDLIARWGGEEFVVLMPQTSVDEARIVCERLRQCLHEQAWPAGLAVTASFGVAQAANAGELDGANTRADAAMYRAKRGGRDRVELG
jgi:diguanylate cyclase (GGDEF)-like protein